MVFGGAVVLVGILVFAGCFYDLSWYLWIWFGVSARVQVGWGVAGLVSGVVSLGRRFARFTVVFWQ